MSDKTINERIGFIAKCIDGLYMWSKTPPKTKAIWINEAINEMQKLKTLVDNEILKEKKEVSDE